MIVINNNISEGSCLLYSPDGELIGEIKNYLAFMDVRYQIKKNKLEGYYISFESQNYAIDSDGILRDYPQRLFNKMENYLSYLILI